MADHRYYRNKILSRMGGSGNPNEIEPILQRCLELRVNEDGDIVVKFRDTPECKDMRPAYERVLKAALRGGRTVYRTLK